MDPCARGAGKKRPPGQRAGRLLQSEGIGEVAPASAARAERTLREARGQAEVNKLGSEQ